MPADNKFLAQHARIRKVRYRGTEVPPQLAVEVYLRALEDELAEIRRALDCAWGLLDSKDFRKCSNHMDRAQQRLHKVIKKFSRKAKP